MRLQSNDLSDNQAIDVRFCFGRIDAEEHVALSDNLNPQLQWLEAPDGTQSFALLCVDPDVPSQPDDVNKEDREIPSELERVNFFHWAMIDIPADVREIAQGACSNGITPKGKQNPTGPQGSRQGLNSYTDWFAGDEDMGGEYFGYDGPCPPWNDSIVHRYQFVLYALDIPSLELRENFTGEDVLKAVKGHTLDSAKLTVTYTLNPRLAS